jgi:hypothetical protein
MENSHSTPKQQRTHYCGFFGKSFEFVQNVEIPIYKQVGGRNAIELQLAHGQWYVKRDYYLKRAQEYMIPMCLSHWLRFLHIKCN